MKNMAPKVLFVTNVLTHYRVPLFELMRDRWDVTFLFYSDGGEWYWKGGSLSVDNLPAVQIPGFWVGKTRVVPRLVSEILTSKFDVLVQGAIGKFALPVGYGIARLKRRPIVLWTGMWHQPDSMAHRLSGFLYKRADALVTYGRHVSSYVISHGADPAGVFEAVQSIETERFSKPRGEHEREPYERIAGGDPLFVYVGRLEPWKGPQVFLSAIRSLDREGLKFKAIFLGRGADRDVLKGRARDWGLEDRVVFLDHLPNEALPAIYQTAEAVVVPSINDPVFQEPWSLVVNEAMAAGALVVASDAVGAVADGLVEDNVTGLTFPAGDVERLADKLRIVLIEDQVRTRLVSRAAERLRRYDYANAVEGFEAAISHALLRR